MPVPVKPDHRICGWRVQAEPALPDLRFWQGDDRPPDLAIRLGPVPDLSDPVDSGPVLQVGRDRTVRRAVAGAARMRIGGGREIVIDPATGSADDWPVFLLGPALAVVALQRGLLPLTAAAVVIGGRTVALVGPSAAGKSTLAAALVGRGHRLLADAVSVVDLAALGGPVLLPSAPQLGLWQDSLEALGIPWAGLAPERAGQRRHRLPVPAFESEPRRLDRLYLLEPARAPDREAVLPIDGPTAAERLRYLVPGGRTAPRIGRPRALSDAIVRLSATVSAARLAVWPGLDRLAATVARLEADAARP